MKVGKKASTSFVCDNCGSSFASWFGKCPECQEWNTLKEFKEPSINPFHSRNGTNGTTSGKAEFAQLKQFAKNTPDSSRLSSGLAELDRVLGGGFVRDEVILLSGEPGVGKSTLLITVLSKQALASDNKVAYISSEEAGHQVEGRCRRLNIKTDSIFFSSQKDIDSILEGLSALIAKNKINLLVFDSLQGLFAANSPGLPGSVSQAKEVLLKIVNFSKQNKLTSLVIGHITKEGEIAGPKFLEHMVDCVLFLEGEQTSNLRILRSFKNRFGPTEEVGFFEMTQTGMAEVLNPSEFFLEWADKAVGKASVAVRQGVRVVFATVETLVVSSSLAFPKRVAKGVDQKRLELILAILKKYLRLAVDKFDIYVNVSGGLKIKDTLADLGVAVALYSSLTAKAFDPKHLFIGELGLLGNVRKTNTLALITKEAKRLGFTKIYSAGQVATIQNLKQI
ncbi:DNA repair protein RadA [Candidatus Roizmanbacteria bacterium RIFOXYB2_FULL_41_10]|uniref:DNA repair protein RadA n=1 Tax=Candidatus Roizmanbacteria bacterium RIFOXYA1_FULL_41_12 TaxID=1802082 RepID=A0A1F7KAN6_9BACT|nr:MAG: DNA repair protein RadA [Candidatus Roizmanbacteria bacterium RIFOXYA2_FULL_41_8]OGK64910.1 MAG: DNA repair protein RadA [Candidatus Roizmanbacteria bacterium RIFOXYA1_FULL_41_12]OGK66829.1 MAG: DNA repair protein RadA [Candidatus Roizmanbacteria bacterium RIFOXYB1_FULL_41_27]OGK70797.1 MAG: DNA repair protein RadA [Candidatus Roizmanbacteria bacterium RIFOXYC1_FULL_41_16]OGK71411.1 MAG: DNA repair protein RadA [Candidatus Roizmanbacteria bacterium RIFOXYB2_FULL_41_10]OGK75624.1 MAG: D